MSIGPGPTSVCDSVGRRRRERTSSPQVKAAVFAVLALLVWFAPLGSAEPQSPSSGSVPRQPVRSTHLASVGYDAHRRILEIEFRAGTIYRYYDVPAATFRGLLEANSQGHYFARNIRDHFRYERISGEGRAL